MNEFARLLHGGRPQVGLWQALAAPYAAEVCARSGFDWLLFDAEHAPNTLTSLLGQLQAVGAHGVEPVVRPPIADRVWIKQLLDLGFRTLLLPMVDDAAQAAELVAATRFPPVGTRGVASSTSRASGFGAVPDYLATAHEDICVVVQVESRTGLDNVAEIAAVEGVDGVFFGPGDLAASLGHLGDPGHPEVRAAIEAALPLVVAGGAFPGIFASGPEDAAHWLDRGVVLVSVGSDVGLLASSARTLARHPYPGR
ncbi:aldolase/citrate lyase family protein [Nocardioides marmotae]|uniref:2-dehydro-3-deoxyglucarate aldolase n=1 Tax=Nocardioides marmotae TaxID=2663857 RepID=A0A6I3IXR9_9ACTN|nr:HpcH/HpaI aldolase/citrate lyase family protein [Nocardioides marmotae]MCR6030265.1 2-dehydro-3-deoxyglucarate aldolase [Gordonia jinghuaiqii]MBC9734444.1 HpcH/HpaI aldolase/citrate lyase family protein [Nocardioides marmotae]MTB85544.1 2-dehydro-3-deoxyglucarate aldolase [Nocardioides marmotae]MTB93897.1 2-dehydro-3-deoxyglucarate aldolase [Nocardioides marmotae]QKE00218.1 HpcH/HpaI aldolase/citrate lyase family protein [Nocardioides marmotae]